MRVDVHVPAADVGVTGLGLAGEGGQRGHADLAGRELAAAGRGGGGAVGVVPVAQERGVAAAEGVHRLRLLERRHRGRAGARGDQAAHERDRLGRGGGVQRGRGEGAVGRATARVGQVLHEVAGQALIGVAFPDEPVLDQAHVDQLHGVGLKLLPGRRHGQARLREQVLAVVQEALVLEQRRAVDLALVGGALHQAGREPAPVAGGQHARQRQGQLVRAELGRQITSPMNTSGVDEPPEISVASVARLVSVSVGAETSVTLMFGYCFSNALISTVRASFAPVPDSGLADQTMLPEVAEAAELRGADAVPPPLLPHADTTSTAAPATAASARPPLRWSPLLGALPRDISAPPGVARPRGR